MDKPDEAPPQGLALSGAPRAPPPPSPLPSPTSLSNSLTGASIANALGLSLSNLLPNAPVAASGGASALFSASGGNGASLGTLLESFVAGNQDLPAASASFWEALGSINPNLALTGGLPSPTSLPQLNAGMSLDQLSQVTKQALSSMLPQHAFVPPAPTAKRKKQGEWDSLDASGALAADQQQLKRTALGSSDGKGNLGNSDEVNSWIAGIAKPVDETKKDRDTGPQGRLEASDSLKYSAAELAKLFQLRIEQQPAPKSLFINRRVAPSFRIRATWSSELPVKQVTAIRACLTADSAGNVEILNGEEPLDKEHLATFSNMKFTVGTHQRLTQLYFEATVVTSRGERFTVMSAPSEPFIVCTNIKQWVKSEGTILKRVVFGDSMQVAWEHCAAMMQKHFFLTVGSQRGLSPEDLQAIHTRLGGQELVHKSVFSEFFSTWYGPILKLAYQKPGRVLWEKRIIFGFLTSAASEALLKGATPGVFVVRFSDGNDAASSSRPVISYVAQDNTIQHYKLTDKERKMPFHEFLRTKKILSTVLQPGSTSSAPSAKRVSAMMNKEALLRDLRPARVKKASEADAEDSDGEEGEGEGMDDVLS